MFKVSALAFAVLIIGVLCCARTGTSTMPRMTALHTATTGPIGLLVGCFLALAHGSMVLTAFTAMSTTALILIMAIAGRCRGAEPSALTTSRGTRRGTGEAT
jgi:CHASE2 domain-containing sensor protein